MKFNLPNTGKRKISVIELSSTALKFLLGKKNFDISNITTNSFEKTPAYKFDKDSFFKENGELNTIYIDKGIIKKLNEFIGVLLNAKVTELYCYRSYGFSKINYQTDLILEYISEKTDLTFTQLEKKEEAYYSFLSSKYIISNELNFDDFFLNVDIGGQTTEIALKENSSKYRFTSLEIGTELVTKLYSNIYPLKEENSSITIIQKIQSEIYKHIDSVLIDLFINMDVNKNSYVLFIGSKIKELTAKTHSKNNRLFICINLNYIKRNLNAMELKLKKSLSKNITPPLDLKTHDKKHLRFYLVLKLYYEIISIYRLENIYISRAGMRHGIYFDKFLNQNT